LVCCTKKNLAALLSHGLTLEAECEPVEEHEARSDEGDRLKSKKTRLKNKILKKILKNKISATCVV
jgi:hypothetical protein